MGYHRILLTVNGTKEQVDVPSNMTLLRMLREKLALTGTKNGCAAGECGACTVMMNGEPVNSCMVLAAECDGAEIITVEGLAKDHQLDPIQEMMMEAGGVQCGFCTPGILITARAVFAIHFFLRPSRIFKNDRVRISANESPVASASSSLIAPQLRPRRK